jgi:stearoyl-CoA desaturase (delta-9 desaturase)
MVDTYGAGTPADWMELHVYQPHSRLGIGLLFVLNTLIFGWIGILMWLIQMAWIPFWAAGVINGIGHWWGYRNGSTKDHSRNISPWGIVVGGEELHNNHHLEPGNPKLSRRQFEFDIGWMWLRLFRAVGLARLRTH